MRYTVTVVFDTEGPLSAQDVDVLAYSAELLATEPVGDDGEHAGWSGSVVSVSISDGGIGT
jgi:hypothetical protein